MKIITYRCFTVLFVLLITLNALHAQEEEDFNEYYYLNPDLDLELEPFYNTYFRGGKAVCKIYGKNDESGTGVLVNNTRNNGKMYILTAAHLLPNYNRNLGVMDKNATREDIDDELLEYVFDFFLERTRPVGINQETDDELEGRTITFNGAKLVTHFSFRPNAYDNNSSYYPAPIDLALLELLQVPKANVKQEFYFAGLNLNPNLTDNEQILIHHPSGFPKKISEPVNSLRGLLWNSVSGDPSERVSSTQNEGISIEDVPDFDLFFSNPLNIPEVWMLNREMGNNSEPPSNGIGGWYDIFTDAVYGIPIEGTSGSPYLDTESRVFAIHTGVDIGLDKNYYNRSVLLTKEFTWNQNLGENFDSLQFFLDPGNTLGDDTSYGGGYFCRNNAIGTNALTYAEQNQFNRKLTFAESFPSTATGSHIAQDNIDISTSIAPGARLLFTAGEINLKEGTDIRAGAEGSGTDVLILPGGRTGIGCVTGCYSIEAGDTKVSDGAVYTHVKNANTVDLAIQIDGVYKPLGEHELSGDPGFLFNIYDSGITTSGTYEVRGIYKNGCNELTVIHQVSITANNLPDTGSAYYTYAQDQYPISDYLISKKNFATDYQVNATYNPESTDNEAEDILFETGLLQNVPYAKTKGFSWSFRDNPDYVADQSSITTLPSWAFTSSEFEVKEKLDLNTLVDGVLKMDVYYPKVKANVSFSDLEALPLIIYAYGGGFLKHDHGKLGEEVCRWLASRGYVVAAIDYRLGLDIADGELAKRSFIRAWQDMEAAVKYWRLKPYYDVTVNSEKHIWKINPNRIYGLGWSAGGITVLNNLYLTREKYNSERGVEGFLFSTTGSYTFKEFNDSSTEISEYWTTYDLEDYPSLPCVVDNINAPCNITETELIQIDQTSGVLTKGVSLSGALPKKEWMFALGSSKALDIHHKKDGIVAFEEGVPFGYLGNFINSVHPLAGGGSKIGVGYGGGSLKAYAQTNGFSGFSLLELSEDHQAGGYNLIGGYHKPHLKFGDNWHKVKDNPKLEPKIMFYVDAFFSKEDGNSAPPKDYFDPADGPPTVLQDQSITAMVSADGRCKFYQLAGQGYALYHFTNKGLPVFNTGEQDFSATASNNVATLSTSPGLIVSNTENNRGLVWQGLGSGLQANAPYSLHLYSKEELQVLNIPTSRDLIAEDDDNCILAGISATNHVNWTDEDDGVPIAPVAQPLALVSTTPVDLIPNPTSGNVDVAFKILEQGIVTLDIVSLSGAVLRQIETTLAPGEQLLNIDINGLSDGTYMIHGYGAGVDFTVTLVIQNK